MLEKGSASTSEGRVRRYISRRGSVKCAYHQRLRISILYETESTVPPPETESQLLTSQAAQQSWASALETVGPVAASRALRGAFSRGVKLADGRTVLTVDRFAQETLCYSGTGPAARWAQRADVLAGPDLDPQAVYEYLFFHVVPAPRTIFRGVKRVPAGHTVVIGPNDVQTERHTSLDFRPKADPSFDALKAEFRGLLRQAVEAELDSGVPACYLSGGTDSSTVAGHIKALAGEVSTYSIGFDAEGYDEMEFARICARHFGTRHHEYYVTPEDLLRHIPTVAAGYDQPFGNSSALPAFCCALRAREDGVEKLLAGDGGDELFGGNARYATQRLYSLYGRLPQAVRSGLIEPMLGLPGAGALPLVRKARNYVRDAKAPPIVRLDNYNLLLRLGPNEVLEEGFLSDVNPRLTAAAKQEVWDQANAAEEIDRHLAYDWRFTLAESDLPKVRMTAALAGLRVGFPLLDDRLVDFSMQLPAHYKVKGQKLRWFFKEALQDFLPPQIIAKPKKGFGLPFGPWAARHSELNRLATDSLRAFATRGVVRPKFADALLRDLLPAHPGYYGEMVWILMMFEQWLRAHAPDWRYEPSGR